MAKDRLQLVVVTAERKLLDEPVDSLQFPLYDGQIGILPGRSPLVGRLGSGELVVTTGGTKRRFFIDGGFCQVKQGVVSLLTQGAIPVEKLDEKTAQQALAEANALSAHDDAEYAAKFRKLERARRMLSMKRRGS